MIKKQYFFIFVACFFTRLSTAETMPVMEPKIDKVVIWGHKLGTHTHSYIHYAFHKTFKHLGYKTYWFDNRDNIKNFDFSNTLFITEGQVIQKMPVRNDCFYWLHNCAPRKFKKLYETGRAITFQVYTHDCIPRKLEKMDDFILYNVEKSIIYQPWATDLLPHEIDEVKATLSPDTLKNKQKTIYFVGSYQHGVADNKKAWNRFATTCRKNGVKFQQLERVSNAKHTELVKKSYFAPAIQGTWQCNKGYIPCRIFKNISYGQFGVTNCKAVHDLFKEKIIYNADTSQLFHDTQAFIKKATLNDLFEQMDFVRDKHTYINRIDNLFAVTKMIYAAKAMKS